jgi:hypothetical protein
MPSAIKTSWSDRWISMAVYGALLLLIALPFVTAYDVHRRQYDLRDHEPESWMGLIQGAYVLFALGALVGAVAAVRGKVASDDLLGRKRAITNGLVGAVFLAYASPLIFFLFKVDGYIWVVARSVWDLISDAL